METTEMVIAVNVLLSLSFCSSPLQGGTTTHELTLRNLLMPWNLLHKLESRLLLPELQFQGKLNTFVSWFLLLLLHPSKSFPYNEGERMKTHMCALWALQVKAAAAKEDKSFVLYYITNLSWCVPTN